MRGLVAAAVALLVASGGLPVPAGAAEAPVATVGGRAIKRSEVEDHVRAKLIELDQQRYEALRDGLDEMIAEELMKLEAKARGTTPEALEREEITAKVGAPSEAEIQKVYDENKEELGDQTLDQVKPQILVYLKEQKEDERREAFLAELKTKHKTTVAMRPPVVQVATAGRPEKGGAKAPVTIVEFSDYECPYCKRAENVVDEVMKAYGDKVRVVFRDYPLPFHKNARLAHEAANCANAQGKFWDYNRKLFANQDDLGEEKLKTYAGEVGLDRAKFDDCLAKKPFKAAIDKDLAEGAKAGVNGTPAFFINGRLLSGAQPLDKFKEVIDEELAAKKSPSSS